MTEHTNGTGATLPPRGRQAPVYPTTTLPSGYTVTCRRLASDLAANLNAQAYKELEGERPAPPVQVLPVAPGERPGDAPQTMAVAHTGDPDYAAALAAWEGRVRQAGAMKLLRVIQGYALLTPTDEEAVRAYREAMGAVGLPMPDDDRELFVWSIVAPTQEDQQALVTFVLGLSEAQQEAIAAAKRTFRRDVPGAPGGAVAGPGGA